MASRRTLKAAEAIREVVSMAILVDLQDPRVRDVTVTKVEVAADMRSAKVYVSVMGDEKKQRLTLRGLESSAGYLQTKVAKRIDTRYTPRITFVLDQGVKKSIEVQRILQEVLPKDASDEYHDGDTVMEIEDDSSSAVQDRPNQQDAADEPAGQGGDNQ
jgi:ribosome-binding factor A